MHLQNDPFSFHETAAMVELRRLQHLLGHPSTPPEMEEQIICLAHQVRNELTVQLLALELACATSSPDQCAPLVRSAASA
jgi:hypothetical protein